MTISISKNSKPKKAKKIVLISCLVAFTIIISLLVSGPIMDTVDKNRFLMLDSQMQKLYKDVKANADEADAWIYEKGCEPEYSGPWPTGGYFCTAKISLTKTVTTAKELADLQNKYYPIINNSEILKASSELNLQLPNDFGINFVVSSAERRYSENNTKISCIYLNKLYQAINGNDFSANEYGTMITNDAGKININLKCTDKSRSDWYVAS